MRIHSDENDLFWGRPASWAGLLPRNPCLKEKAQAGATSLHTLNSKGTEAMAPNVLPKKAESEGSLARHDRGHSCPQMHRGRSLFPVSD